MGVAINWRSEQGRRTGDNRDCCGVGLRFDATLSIVLDGSSSGDNSGEFARLFARDLIDWFMLAEDVTALTIIDQLHEVHTALSPKFSRDSASYVITHLEKEGAVQLLHAGDCLAGLCEKTPYIDWRTQPHTLANAVDDMSIEDIARSPMRNLITRSFRTREFMAPDVSELTLEVDETLVLATDGFWAVLDQEQQAGFLAGEEFPNHEGRDDCSALSLRLVEGQSDTIGGGVNDNLYVAGKGRH